MRLIDFHCSISTANDKRVREVVKSLELRGYIAHSGQSYHFLGANVVDHAAMIAILARALLLAPIVDRAWIAHHVGALIAGETNEARQLYQAIKASYPIAVTRSLGHAKQWLRDQARGSERIGLVASSGASRLKPEGINVHEKIDAQTWFLNGKDDVRSSFYMEDPATEFDIQGLELDWVGVCWDADFRSVDGGWQSYRFSGTRWQNVNDANRRVYLANAYRVLLTRARQGMVIYVPTGDVIDATRPPSYYDGTAALLSKCGLPLL